MRRVTPFSAASSTEIDVIKRIIRQYCLNISLKFLDNWIFTIIRSLQQCKFSRHYIYKTSSIFCCSPKSENLKLNVNISAQECAESLQNY